MQLSFLLTPLRHSATAPLRAGQDIHQNIKRTHSSFFTFDFIEFLLTRQSQRKKFLYFALASFVILTFQIFLK